VKYSKFKLLFGDIHCHSNLSLCGVCRGKKDLLEKDFYFHGSILRDYFEEKDAYESVDLLYEYARDKAKLDFAAITDHDFSMTDEMWAFIRRKASEWYSPGKFTTFSAYEWTSYAYGHRNVYFLTDDKPIFRCVNYGKYPSSTKGYSPADLWSFLRKVEAKAITIPHHPSITQFPVDWSYYDPEFDRLVEIASIWGVFEYYGNPVYCMSSDNLPRFFVVDALEKGYRLGIIGGGDTHDCYPGSPFRPVIIKNRPPQMKYLNSLTTGFVEYFLYNPFGAGLAAVYAEHNTREDIFRALYERRAYAVLGTRLRLEFSIDDYLMGSEIKVSDPNYKPEISVRVESDEPIDKVELIRNGKAIYREYGPRRAISFKYIDEEKPCRRLNYYYVRVLERTGGRAWSSPIWIYYTGLRDLIAEVKLRKLVLRLGDMREVEVFFSKTKPIRTMKPPNLSNYSRGSFFWIEETKDYSVVLKARFKSYEPVNFKGRLKISGFDTYTVEPVNFAIWKYGGDLFRDNYAGIIEWDVTPSSNLNLLDTSSVKGLDIHIQLNYREDCIAEVEAYQNGLKVPGETHVNGIKVPKIPFKIVIYSRKDLKTHKIYLTNEKTIKIPADTKYCIIYPAYFTKTKLKEAILSIQ